MELKIKKSGFLELLHWSQGIVERKSTMPVLSNLLIEAAGKRLTVSATDLEIGLVAEGTAEIVKGGKAVVGARQLYDIVRELPEESVKVIGRENHRIEIVSGKSTFKIVGMAPEEFPSLPLPQEKNRFQLPAAHVAEMIAKTLYAVSTDETRYTLNGLLLEKQPQGEKSFLRLVATDGHRLSTIDRPGGEKLDLPKGVIIPRKGIAELKKLAEAAGEGKAIEFALDEKGILARCGGVTLAVRLIEGEFPAYRDVIPKKNDKLVSVPRAVLAGALKRASLLTVDRARGVRMAVSPGLVELTSSNPDLGEAKEELAVDYKGESFQVGFNARYLLDVLNVLEDEKVLLELKDEVSPCLVRSEFDRGFTALVMPMRL